MVEVDVFKNKCPSIIEFSEDNGKFSGENDGNEKHFWE